MPFTHHVIETSFRPASEDRVFVCEVEGGLLVALADGAGGLPGGARAAEIFVKLASSVANAGADLWNEAAWVRRLGEVDREIVADRLAGETTGVVLVVGEGGIFGASAGDSEAWVIQGGQPDVLTANQQRKRRLGSGRVVPEAFFRPDFQGTLVVASDGLFAYARADAICAAVGNGTLAEIGERLVQLVRLPTDTFMDDVAVVVVRGTM